MPGLAPLSAGITLAPRTDINRKEAYLRSRHSLKKLRKPSRWYILGIATMPTKNRSRVCPITSWHLSPMAAELLKPAFDSDWPALSGFARRWSGYGVPRRMDAGKGRLKPLA